MTAFRRGPKAGILCACKDEELTGRIIMGSEARR